MDKKEDKFVYFDFGGVMAQTKPSLLKIADNLGIDHDRFLSIWSPIDDLACQGNITSAELWSRCGFFQDLTSEWIGGFKIIPEVHALMTQVAAICKIGILSNLYTGLYPTMLSMGFIPDLQYNAVIISSEHRTIKPESQIFEIAERESRQIPSQLILIDDKPANITAVKTRGWKGVLYDNTNPQLAIDEVLRLNTMNFIPR